jgi:hypothetical protein
MLRAIVLALILSLTGLAEQTQSPEVEIKAKIASPREAALSALVEKQQVRHFELHRFFIPVTQGNLQWLASQVGAKPDEVLVVWKLMREWDASRAQRFKNPS